MSTAKRIVGRASSSPARTAPARRPARSPVERTAAADDRRVVEGRVTEVLADGRARLTTADGRVVDCRCPQHVNVDWLRAAVALAPVDAEASLAKGRPGTLWCLFPSPQHRAAIVRHLELAASETVKIACGDSTLSLDRGGTVRVRGRDVAARGSRVARLLGGTVRIN